MDLLRYLEQAIGAISEWESSWGEYKRHFSLDVDEALFARALEQYTSRLRNNYPFFHPRYAGQMLKPPHPAAITAYVAAMLINPNNHALDGGPATAAMEKEVVNDLAAMFHLPQPVLGHLTSSGTIANLESLWVSRHLAPDKLIVFNEDAHYTHSRMSEVLRVQTATIPTDSHGRMSLDHLEDTLRTRDVGTVVLTAGTTGPGIVDPISDVLTLRDRYGFRLHVDAAYGGFFSLLAWGESPLLSESVRNDLKAIRHCDSVVVDPHKHGLQPYGCGCVLFSDPEVGRFYKHDSPYTYFTSDELHLGEISLECSRAGASAGALWFTLQLLPLKPDDGLGLVLGAGLRAAANWAMRIEESTELALYLRPDLDILTFVPRLENARSSTVDELSGLLFEKAMSDEQDPIFLSVLRVAGERLAPILPGLEVDRSPVRILRSVLMKPEHELYVDHLHERISGVARDLLASRGGG